MSFLSSMQYAAILIKASFSINQRNLISKELLPDFCPRLVNGEWQAPLRPHLAA
jgi:hypothetical protein